MVESGTNQQIGYILRSYPRLSQTFILNEILALEQVGVNIQIFALTNPEEEIIQPQVRQVHAPVRYLARDVHDTPRKALQAHAAAFLRHPIGYLRALLYTLRKPEIDSGYTNSSRGECFSTAIRLARMIDRADRQSVPRIDHLHAHFAHDPAFIAHLVHLITGIPYSFTAHARDLFQVPATVLADRIRHASAVVTCCQNNLNYLAEIAPAERKKFSMIYHGVNIQHFQPPANPQAQPVVKPVVQQDPAGETGDPLILSVGRLVEKKGFLDLLAALQLVKAQGHRFQCEIYGEGPLRQEISHSIEALGLTGWACLAGNRDQSQLLPIFHNASLFALTPTVTEDGDRDGIPNVLVEAMAVGLPVVSTRTAGIPELITHDQTGLLYAPHDVDGIAAGIIALLNDARKRERLGKAAREMVIEHFDSNRAAGLLKDLFTRNLVPTGYREFAQPREFGLRG